MTYISIRKNYLHRCLKNRIYAEATVLTVRFVTCSGWMAVHWLIGCVGACLVGWLIDWQNKPTNDKQQLTVAPTVLRRRKQNINVYTRHRRWLWKGANKIFCRWWKYRINFRINYIVVKRLLQLMGGGQPSLQAYCIPLTTECCLGYNRSRM